MKLSSLVLISLMTVAAAGAQEKDSGAARNQAASKTAPKDSHKLEIPAGAVASEDGSYHYTDTQGKKWIYRKTPFGVARIEEKAVEAKADDKPLEPPKGMKATENGDNIHFERPGPFGVYKWDRKKTELNDMEQAVWDREKARTASKQD
jgi:hypothetical protein